MIEQVQDVFLFDDIRIESGTFRAFKAGEVIRLEPKALRLLIFLIEHRERLAEKEEILAAVWSGTNVTDNALTREIAKLRKTLGDDPKRPKYIQTVHTRGYRFIAELHLGNGDDTAAKVEIETVAAAETRPESFPERRLIGDSAPNAAAESAESPRARLPLPYLGAIAIAGALGLCLVVVIVFWKYQPKSKQSQPVIVPTSVAVLPFKTTGAGDEYIGVELADALTNRLGNSSHLSVRPMMTVLHYSESQLDPKTIGTLLKVDYVLYGEIERSRQRMTTQLIRVRDGAPLLAENYNESFDDIFQLEDSVCARVLGNLLVTLDHEETQRFRKRYTDNQQAYETFLKAHYFMNKATKDETYKSIDYFRQAIDLDPKYAMAYAGLSDCYMRLGRFGVAPAEFVPKSRTAVMKALELDETVAYAHSMLGRIAYQFDWDFSRAGREYARARDLEPTLVHSWYAAYLLTINRVADAEIEDQRFEEFLPFAPGSHLPQYFYFTGQYDRAIDVLKRKLETNPGFPPLHETLGLVYEQKGRNTEAIAEFQKAIDLSSGEYGLGALGYLYAAQGRKADAQNAIERLDQGSKDIYVSPYQKAVIYAGLGEKAEALKFLEKAFGERSLPAQSLRFDPRLGELRRDPRFKDFMSRKGVPL